jgi:alkylation response protein AidB-like acyl-CoA dehydrogenase
VTRAQYQCVRPAQSAIAPRGPQRSGESLKLALSSEDAAFREEMREFFVAEIPAEIRERVRAGHPHLPDDMVTSQRILNAHGLAVPNWPVEWGGKDWTPLQRQIWLDELQLAGVPEPLAFNAKMVGPVIAQFGSDELKRRFLPPTANLDIWWCQGFSEPEAGSDLASLRTTAVRDGDSYVINGQKTWTTLGQHADWIFVLARTDPNAPKRQAGISFLLVEMATPGITLRPIKLIDGSYEVNEVFFEDVRVPADQLVGEENQGWTYAKFLLGNERTGIARIGLTKTWLAQAKERAAQIPTGAGTLIDDPLFAARLAEVENQVLALELTQMRVSGAESEGKANPASSILKLCGSQLQQAATELLLEVAGPDALPVAIDDAIGAPVWAQDTAPRYLNYRKTSIYGGTSEVQRSIIASTILGL